MADQSGGQVPIGVQLGLGAGWQPTGGIVDFVQLDSNQGRIHVVRSSTIVGSFGVVFDDTAFTEFAHAASEAASGLVLPSPATLIVPGPPQHNGHG